MTYPEPPIILDLDPSGYVMGLGQAERQTDAFGSTVRTASLAMTPMAAAMNSITPSRAVLAGFAGFATVAGKAEQQLSTLRATAKTTDANFGALTKSTRSLAKELPIGNQGARELVTTMSKMGILAKGQEKSFGDLAKVFVKLGGATGESPTGLAHGMIQLSRATNVGFQPQRMKNLTDSLTTVAAKSGASATGILAFSKAIAPMAQVSGIGTTKIMGISAAFSKMGEDGFVAANAFNKMLGDMSRSVREGSPEMAKYAQIVGQSAEEFERLFKNDPTEAITRVTEAIGAAGVAGPRMLEQLGLEGPRTMRSIQQLTQGGELRTSVATAVGGYGSGATEEAAKEAFGGLADSMTQLGAASGQAAEALGTPFLGALTHVTDAMGAVASGFGRVLETSAVEKTLKAISYAALPLLAAFKLMPALITALGLRQAATSGPVRGFAGGMAGVGAPGGGFWGRLLGGNAYNERVLAGQSVGGRVMTPINQRAAAAGAATGRFMQSMVPGTGAGILPLLRGGGVTGAAMYLRMIGETARQSRTPWHMREPGKILPATAAFDQLRDTRTSIRGAVDQGLLTRSEGRGAMRAATAEVIRAQGGFATALKTLTGATLRAGYEIGRATPGLVGRTGGKAIGMLGRGVGSVVGAMGGVAGVAMMAGMAGWQIKSSSDATTKERKEQVLNQTSFIDDYRVAMGKATEATSTFAGQMQAANKANITGAGSVSEARRVTEEDLRSAARADPNKDRVRDYRGMSDEAVARRIQGGLSTTGATADEIQRIQQDLLLSGISAERVRSLSEGIPTTQGLGGDYTTNVAGQVSDISGMERRGGFRGWLGARGAGFNPIKWVTGDDTRGTVDTLSGQQVTRASELTKEISERGKERAGVYNPEYAREQMFSETEAAIQAAFEAGDKDLAEQLMKNFQADQPGVSDANRSKAFTQEQIEEAGGYIQALAARDTGFREVHTQHQADVAAGRTEMRLDEGWISRNLKDSPLAPLFSQTGTGQANRLVSDLLQSPESPQLQAQALQSAMAEARESGISMGDLAVAASQAANKLGELDDATIAFLGALQRAAMFQMRVQEPFQSASQTRTDRANVSAEALRTLPKTRQYKEEREGHAEQLQGIEAEAMGQANQILAQRREVQVQQRRMDEDFDLQRVHQKDDTDRQIERMEEQHGIALFRTQREYNRSREYAQEDFDRQRMIARRDFDKQMARQAEDGARAMYDAYQRIQVQPTWDAWNLRGNLEDQNRAIQEQVANLGRLRDMGGSADLISLLGLNDPKNAQQLANLVADVTSDPQVLGALNAAAAERQKAGGALFSDEANLGLKRQVEDFGTAMKDQEDIFQVTMKRAAAAYETTTTDMADDHRRTMDYAAADTERMLERFEANVTKTLARMDEDITRADEAIVTDLAGYHEMLTSMINGQTVEFAGKTKSTLAGVLGEVAGFKDDLHALLEEGGLDLEFTLSVQMPEAAQAQRARNFREGLGDGEGESEQPHGVQNMMAAIREEFPGTPLNSGLRPGAKTSNGSLSYHARGRAVDVPPSMEVFSYLRSRFGADSKELIYSPAGSRQIKNGRPHNYTGTTKEAHYDHVHWALAKGGIATEPTKALIAEAGHNEAVIPLNAQGVAVLADAMRTFMTREDSAALQAGGGVTYVTYDSSTHITDAGTHFHGDIEVQAQDPNEMAKKLAAKQRRDNLTAPPQRRGRG